MGSLEQVSELLLEWEREDNERRDVTPIIIRLAEIFELETQSFLKQDPDPFDDRHPSRSQPDCTLGHILKAVFRNQRIIDEMVKVYSQRDIIELNTAVCRFLLDILLGLENVIFQEESFILRLFQWAETADNPLQTYATGLLAAAMDVPEIASSYREKNAYFVPLMLKRLKEISKKYLQSTDSCKESNATTSLGIYENGINDKQNFPFNDAFKSNKRMSKRKKESSKSRFSPLHSATKQKEKKSSLKIPPIDETVINESSNSKWTEYMLGSYQVFPLTLAAQQRYILQYLTPMGEYQELIGYVFEENALLLILQYIDLNRNSDLRLAFEALKYLASLLCHKKIAIEFLNIGGLQLLLNVPRPSIAAAGVSFCFYYLGYLEEALEKICMFPSSVISDLVRYALWLLEGSHDSSRCHATLFFGFGFAFKVILEHFDQQDGLRKLFNVMSTLDIFVSRNARTLTDDEIFANRLTVRHVCLALKKYFEAHLEIRIEEIRQSISPSCISELHLDVKFSKAASLTSDTAERNIEILHELPMLPLFHWKPVSEFENLDGVTFLLELISSYFELSYSGRAETVKNALDVLKVCSVTASTIEKFCEKISSPETVPVTGISILLQAAEGETIPVAEIQRSALLTIINCMCSPVKRVDGKSLTVADGKERIFSTSHLIDKVQKAVQTKNGIIILINLLSIKTPLSDADAIRVLACRALCGLARSQNVAQIISKLPLITGGQLIDLMREPVLQNKCHEQVQFCKYGLELIGSVTGAPLSSGSEYSLLNKICLSEVTSKTKVTYNDHQLLKLISDHLSEKGFNQTVQCLQKEIKEKSVAKSTIHLDPFPSVLNNSVGTQPIKKSNLLEKSFRVHNISSSSACESPVSSVPPSSIPLKIVVNKKLQITEERQPCRLQKSQMCSGSYIRSPAFSMKHQNSAVPYKSSQSNISLDSIVKEYLRKQHSLCKNPMLACPAFDLFVPHKCPEPHFRRNAATNLALRLQKRENSFKDGGYQGAALNRKHIYSRFRLCRTCRDEEGFCDFSICTFFKNGDEPVPKMLIGTTNGSVKLFNANTGKQILTKECHLRKIVHIDSKESTPLFLTSDISRYGHTSLWNLSTDIDLVHNFSDVIYMEFGKRSMERLIGINRDEICIYDLTTRTAVLSFFYGELGNHYTKRRATFDYSDELILCDGLLMDSRNFELLHKLDKLNSSGNGVFHPNGREIISNTEIWDIRTFKLLRTVSALDECSVTFNKTGDIIYGVLNNQYSFYTFDAHDYSTISTINFKKTLYHLATDVNDRYIGTIESVGGLDCVCKVYEVGRTKQAGDENGDESEDSDDSDDNDDDNDYSDIDGPGTEAGEEENNDESDISWDEDIRWLSSDDDEVAFSLNTSMED